jgi:hypothetical protein
MRTEEEIKGDSIYLHKAHNLRLLPDWLKSGLATPVPCIYYAIIKGKMNVRSLTFCYLMQMQTGN